MKKQVFENVRELEQKSQTLVCKDNIWKFMKVCAAAGIIVFAGAYEVDVANGMDIAGQWFYE